MPMLLEQTLETIGFDPVETVLYGHVADFDMAEHKIMPSSA